MQDHNYTVSKFTVKEMDQTPISLREVRLNRKQRRKNKKLLKKAS